MSRFRWSSPFSFILAAGGAAVGLGNIWKFPYITGMNGGGAFVLMYLLCIFLVGVPIFIAELYIGQSAQANTVKAFHHLKPNSYWGFSGYLGVASAFIILSLYGVVSGWILDFEFQALTGKLLQGTSKTVNSQLTDLLASPVRQIFWFLIFIFTSGLVVALGLKRGLERWNKILMPLLFLMLIGLFTFSISLDGFAPALKFMFNPDFSKLTSQALLEAIGHSFFTLSLGIGVIMIYGSYLSPKESLPKIAFSVALLDTFVAIVAGLIIFSIVFTFGLDAKSGPELIFVTLPNLFQQMPGGSLLAIIFFLLISFAALTSAISILELLVSYLVESHGWSRNKAVLSASFGSFLVGLLNVFSHNIFSEIKIFNLTFFDGFDKLTSSYMLPLGGLITVLFYGWTLGPRAVQSSFHKHKPFFYYWLLLSARFIAPICIVIIMLKSIFD